MTMIVTRDRVVLSKSVLEINKDDHGNRDTKVVRWLLSIPVNFVGFSLLIFFEIMYFSMEKKMYQVMQLF